MKNSFASNRLFFKLKFLAEYLNERLAEYLNFFFKKKILNLNF